MFSVRCVPGGRGSRPGWWRPQHDPWKAPGCQLRMWRHLLQASVRRPCSSFCRGEDRASREDTVHPAQAQPPATARRWRLVPLDVCAATKQPGARRPGAAAEETPVSAVRTTVGTVMAVPRFPFAMARAEAPKKASEERFHVVIDLVVVPVPQGLKAEMRVDVGLFNSELLYVSRLI